MDAQHLAEDGLAKHEDSSSSKNEQVETVRTISRVPGNSNYYEKNGLRTYGDEMDHDHEQPVW